MKNKYATVFSNQTGISARVCPQGHVSLRVGYASLTLRRDNFLDLVQVIRAVENHLSEKTLPWPAEPRH